MSLSDEQWKFLKDVAKLIEFIDEKGHKATGGELQRTKEQQALHVKNGVSWTSDSYHLKQLAIDLHIFINGVYLGMCSNAEAFKHSEFIGAYWENLDSKNVWGGRWKNMDWPHFERRV